VIRKNYWITDRHAINSHAGSKISFSAAGSGYGPSKNYGFFVQNHISTLDKLGEWYYNGTSKAFAFFFGSSNPSAMEVKVSTLDYLVNKSSYSIGHLSFKNLHFEGANKDALYLKGGKDIQIQHCDITYSGVNSVFAEGASNLKVENNKILGSNNNGLKLMSSTTG